MVNDLVTILVVVLFFVAIIYLLSSPKKFAEVNFGKVKVKAEIADNPIKRAKGLMFRKNLEENKGMLFNFNNEDYHTFWMMNTSIPLDIIWVNENKEIVDIVEDAQPCFINCTSHKPDEKAKYVVEVNSNFTKNYGINVGDKVSIN